MWNSSQIRHCLAAGIATILVLASASPAYATDTLSLNMRDVSIAEIMELLARKARANIVLTNGVSGDVSVNLYDTDLETAIRAVADAAGYAVEKRNGSYFIIAREDAGKYSNGGLTVVRSFEVSYVDATVAAEVIAPLLSRYGEVTAVPDRRLVIIRDQPEFLVGVAEMMAVLDRKPRQILIEAKILELTLDDTQSYGFDWTKFFSNQKGEGSFGTNALTSPGSPGAFFSLSQDKLSIALNALRSRGQVRTLSAPRLLALENQEASVVIGDRQGFRVTTTINQITTESIEFLESGVILRVTPAIDVDGRIMLNIHPEVSTGTITDGIPSQTTTEVTTRLLLPDSHSVFIGGLIKNSLTKSTSGVPILGSIPGVRRLFSKDQTIAMNTETIVIITPRLIEVADSDWQTDSIEQLEYNESVLQDNLRKNRAQMERLFPTAKSRPSIPAATDQTGGITRIADVTELREPGSFLASEGSVEKVVIDERTGDNTPAYAAQSDTSVYGDNIVGQFANAAQWEESVPAEARRESIPAVPTASDGAVLTAVETKKVASAVLSSVDNSSSVVESEKPAPAVLSPVTVLGHDAVENYESIAALKNQAIDEAKPVSGPAITVYDLGAVTLAAAEAGKPSPEVQIPESRPFVEPEDSDSPKQPENVAESGNVEPSYTDDDHSLAEYFSDAVQIETDHRDNIQVAETIIPVNHHDTVRQPAELTNFLDDDSVTEQIAETVIAVDHSETVEQPVETNHSTDDYTITEQVAETVIAVDRPETVAQPVEANHFSEDYSVTEQIAEAASEIDRDDAVEQPAALTSSTDNYNVTEPVSDAPITGDDYAADQVVSVIEQNPVELSDSAIATGMVATQPAQTLQSDPADEAEFSLSDVYTLKLYQARNSASAHAFLDRHETHNSLMQVISAPGVPGLVVIYGHYLDNRAARKAARKLPKSIRRLKPEVVPLVELQPILADSSVD